MSSTALKSKKAVKDIKISKSLSDKYALDVLALPAVLFVLLFSYMPMFGIIIAFKNFNPNLGIFGSQWCGFDNFKFFFESNDAFRITRNTVLYGIVFQIAGTFAAVGLAIVLYEVRKKAALKFYQTVYILPYFMSWVIVAYIVYALLNPTMGVANKLVEFLGFDKISWYSDPVYWPFILIICNVWKGVGMSSIIYYAALMGIDNSILEAARVDGATKLQENWYIKIPELSSVIIITLILGMGNIIRGDFGLFYQVPKDIGVLYPTTDIIDTYVYRGLQGGNMSVSSAIGLFQSVVGLFLIVFTNWVVKKIDPDKSLF